MSAACSAESGQRRRREQGDGVGFLAGEIMQAADFNRLRWLRHRIVIKRLSVVVVVKGR
jgi:hypothetical protein